jgi:hypothetical protein
MRYQLTIALLLALLQAYGLCEMTVEYSDLPATRDLNLTVPGEGVVELSYGPYLTGPGTGMGGEEITVTANLPETIPLGVTPTRMLAGQEMIESCIEVFMSTAGLTIDRKGYYPNETVIMTVKSHRGTSLYLNITGADQKSFEAELNGESVMVFNPQHLGQYEITAMLSYGPYSWIKKENFVVTDKLACKIKNKEITAGVLTSVSADVEGGTLPYSYSWKTDNVTARERVLMHAFTGGRHEVSLIVTDSLGRTASCSGIIKSKEELFEIALKLEDKENGEFIGDALVEAGNSKAKSNINGLAVLMLPRGNFTAVFSHDSYHSKTIELDVSGAASFTEVMERKNEAQKEVPKITIDDPDEGILMKRNDLQFQYTVESRTGVKYCKLLVNEQSLLGMRVKGTHDDVQTGQTMVFHANIPNGEYRWRIRCQNSIGMGYSDLYNITVRGTAEVQSGQPSQGTAQQGTAQATATQSVNDVTLELSQADKILADIQAGILHLDSLAGIDRIAAQKLKLYENLLSKKRSAEEAKRQLSDLGSLSISASDFNSKKAQILAELRSKEILTQFQLISKQDIIEPASDEAIELHLREYLLAKNRSTTKSEMKKLITEAKRLRDLADIESTYIVVQLTYSSGEKRGISLVDRTISYDEDPGSASIVEFIPKAVAQDISDIRIEQQYELINRDPVISFPSETKAIHYFVEKKTDIDELAGAKAILLPRPDMVLPTGHTTRGVTGTTSFLVAVLCAAVLAAGYFSVYRDTDRRAALLDALKDIIVKIKPAGREGRLKHRLIACMDLLEQGEREKAFAMYPGILEKLHKAPYPLQEQSAPAIKLLSDELELFCLCRHIGEAKERLARGETVEQDFAQKIEQAYSALPERQQSAARQGYFDYCLKYNLTRMRSESTETIDDSIFRKR